MKSITLYTAIVLGFLITGFTGIVRSQSCGNYYPLTTGSSWEMTNYNDNDKVTGKSVSLVTQSVTDAASGVVATVQTTSKDKKDTVTGKSDITIKCKAGKIYMDMKNFAISSQTEKGKNVEIKTDGTWLEIPQTLTVGMTLPDATGTITMYSNGALTTTMKISITKRTVAAKETVTAGSDTYDCYKITQEAKTEMIIMGMSIPTITKTSEYYATGTGLVKSQTYSKNDKLMGYSLLTKIIKK